MAAIPRVAVAIPVAVAKILARPPIRAAAEILARTTVGRAARKLLVAAEFSRGPIAFPRRPRTIRAVSPRAVAVLAKTLAARGVGALFTAAILAAGTVIALEVRAVAARRIGPLFAATVLAGTVVALAGVRLAGARIGLFVIGPGALGPGGIRALLAFALALEILAGALGELLLGPPRGAGTALAAARPVTPAAGIVVF